MKIKKGIKTRYIIYKILKKLRNGDIKLENIFLDKFLDNKLIKSDYKMINNVVLNSMRYHKKIEEIIKNNAKKIDLYSDSYFLLLGAITQLIILHFKNFAVIDSTVELAKNKKIKTSPKFINGVLRNIDRKRDIIKLQSDFSKLPNWFKKRVPDWNNKDKNNFAETIRYEPHLHIVFKNKKDIKKIKINKIQTSGNSIALENNHSVIDIEGYNDGLWWVQDYSAMMPIHLINDIKNKFIADLCAAPGGKTFQLLSKGAKLDAYDKNKDKIDLMKKNLKRINFNCKIIKQNIFDIDDDNKYDLVFLDAPCSAIGTIRRNPEIFFRKKEPDFSYIKTIQYKLLKKAKNLVKKNGILVYMVCSFLKDECENQIYNFLTENNNFSILKYSTENIKTENSFISKEGFFLTSPSQLNNNVFIDGFFAAKLKKNE